MGGRVVTATPETYRKLGARGGGKPVAAVLRVGKKGPKGNPIEATGQDAGFYVVRAEAIGTAAKLTRPLHAAFTPYNDQPPADRRTFKAVLPYSTVEQVWEMRRTAKEIKEYPRQPSRFVTCQSTDGETAERLYQLSQQSAERSPQDDGAPDDAERIAGTPEDEHWYRIPCPGDLCPHHIRRECHPNSTLYLLADEDDCPHVLLRFWTGGGATTVNRIASFFDDLHETVRGFNLELTNLATLPVVLSLGQGMNRKEGRRYPVVSITLREMATVALKAQRERFAEAGAVLELPAAIDGEVIPEEDETSKAHDAVDTSPGRPQTVVGDDDAEQGSLL